MPVAHASGTEVHYTISGNGPGLVLVHGTSLDAATNYGHIVEHFTGDRTVITPDYAGCGKTTAPAGDLTLDLLVDQVVAATRDGANGPVDLVGFSLGAVVAASIAARRPDLVRRLVLIAGWTHSEDPRLRLGLETWGEVMAASPELTSAVVPLLAFSPAFLSGLGPDGLTGLRSVEPAHGTRRQIALDLRIDIRDELPRITAPTLVIGCTLDQLIPVENARAVHEAIPGSDYTEIESGHLVLFEKPTELVLRIRNFLDTPS
ncbi:alpha/beta hydrolase [Streptomyces sp. WMMC500]|uniref:alpha/beta fold hydrolase n=1 Tax=Streptomyces sp. WMMC500 TaxID=3015154 RepID=UPI00248CC0EE|nr:alpha/beta hydrolase [Streptomyces sp. WMMC500]WBB58488.1 alpha/beta hydrolase [Streptomyces sp. WMMC500]